MTPTFRSLSMSTVTRTVRVDPARGGEYPPELYKHDGIAPVLSGLDQIDDAAIASYHEQGYLAVANVYPQQMVQDATNALSDLIAGRNEKFNNIQLEAGTVKDGTFDPATMENLVRRLGTFTSYDDRLKAMLDYQPVRDLLNRLASETMEPYQEMALLKPPSGREKPWHQDHAYFDIDLSRHIIGIWIALDQATVDNGCMHLLPGKHRQAFVHFHRRDWQICDSTTLQIKDFCLAVPLEPGGVLFFDSYLPHGTPTNHSNQRRRALQFHYKQVSAANIPPQERMAVFGEGGKDVTC
jgi:phytanoyl-CoA hydroxylase